MSRHIMGRGYKEAIDLYEQQKQAFLRQLNQNINWENQEIQKQFLNDISQHPPEDLENIVNNLVTEINNLISTSEGKVKVLHNFLKQKYQKKEISKNKALELAQKYINKFFTPEFIRSKILAKLGTVGGQRLEYIDDNALLGKVKMLLSMALRHEVLNPSNYTKKTVEGVLYEHAITGGLTKYFSKIPDFEKVVSIEAIGAKGIRGDIKITLNDKIFEGREEGNSSLPSTFEAQIKNYDVDAKLKEHSTKITVGSASELLKELESSKDYNTTVIDSIYFLSQKGKVIQAIGEKVFLYGYSNGNFKFTADLIKQCRKQNYALAFSNLNYKNSNQRAYINWIQQKRK